MFRLKEDDDGVDDDPYAEKAACAEPQDASPEFTFVKAVYAQVSEKEAEGEGYPFVVFTLCGHKNLRLFP